MLRSYLVIWTVISLLGAILFTGCAVKQGSILPEGNGAFVVSTFPAAGDFNVSPFVRLEIRFSQKVDPGTEESFEIYGGSGRVDGATQWMDPMTLSFKPGKPLRDGASYQCVLRDGKSADGTPLIGVPYIWVFSTAR